MNMKGSADDDLKLAFSGSYAARGLGVIAFSVAGYSVGGAGHGCDGALPQGVGAVPGGGRPLGNDAGGAGRYFLVLPECGRGQGVDSHGSDRSSPKRREIQISNTGCTNHVEA